MQITLKDQTTIDLPEGSTGKELAEKLHLQGPSQSLAALINGTLYDLNWPLREGDRVVLVSFEDPQGKEIFWHTSAHLLAQAILRLWPDAKPTIGPPIENGFYYDFANLSISETDFARIEAEMEAIVAENYRSERHRFANKEEATKSFAHNPYKCELIREIPEGEELTAYRQGEFFDFCRGPHLYSLGKIKAFKILKTSGAYWRGDPAKEMLTRVYAISFPDKKLLKEYLYQLEEAKRRDHRLIGQQLDLFSIKEVAAGMPFIHPKGAIIWNQLVAYLRELQHNAGYVEIRTPTMLGCQLWERSGHWANYRENMFVSEVEKQTYVIKPMNCPGCMLYYGSHSHSYKELPLRIGEFGHVHRNEASGSLSGLFRVRSFHQDDAHLFMRPDQIEQEILGVLNLADTLYSTFNLHYRVELSTRPEKNTIGSDEQWEVATRGLKNALKAWGKEFRINEGDGAFYGPKIDFHIRDAINRTWQCGTVQLDMALPERFELEYTAADGSRQRPVMVHRAIFGSIERFLGIMIEHFAGKFPLWISPHQVRIITVADRHLPYAEALVKKMKAAGLHCDVDESGESVAKKIRNAQLLQINYILTVGDREMEHATINIRTRDNAQHGEMAVDSFLAAILQELEARALHSSFCHTEKM